EPVRIFNSGATLEDPVTFGEYRLTYRTGDIVSPRVEAAEPLVLELQDFCDAVRGLVLPRVTASLGLEVLRMIEAVDSALADVGAGSRPYAPVYEPHFARTIAADLPDSPHGTAGVDVFAAADSLPFADESFDCAVCTEVLEHCPRPGDVLRELRRVLRPG